MNLWHEIETGPKAPEVVNIIVEIPKGSGNKYEYDKKRNLIRLDRVLFSAVYYPGDYGFIPKTMSDDGDPLDAIVLLEKPTYPGVLLEARVIGVLMMEDTGEMDEKILCVIDKDPRYKEQKDISDVREHTLKEIANFFETYKKLEGKETKILGWKDAKAARKIIEESIAKYNKKFGKA
ncbi:MAG: inorganic diphosphatase [Candidatus Micrarchaeaceae archaeon]